MNSTADDRQRRLTLSQEAGFDLKDYIRNHEHHAGKPSFLSFRELDVLMCIVPGPLGLGMDNRTAGRFLKINRKTVWRILKGLEEKFPAAFEKIDSMWDTMNRQRHGLKCVRSFEGLMGGMQAAEDNGKFPNPETGHHVDEITDHF